MFHIKRLSRSLEGCWLACRILLWGPWCGFLDCCLFLCPGGKLAFPCQLLRNVQSYVSRSSAGTKLGGRTTFDCVSGLVILNQALRFWSCECEITYFPTRGHACKTFPFPMNTFHFVNCLMFRIKRLNRCLEGCWLACRILLWGPWCGFLDCCLFLCPGGKLAFPCQLLRNVQSYVSRSSAGTNLAVELLWLCFRPCHFEPGA